MDSSSIVKLYIDEPAFAETREAAARTDGIATSMVAYPEVRAAFAAKHRNGEFTEPELQRLVRDFDSDWPTFYVIAVSGSVVQAAGDLTEKHILSGFDAIHLASAIELRDQGVDSIDFAVADRRLGTAVIALGFVAV